MRDIGLTKDEALAEVERQTEEMKKQAAIKEDRQANSEGHYGYDAEWRVAERAMIDAGAARARIWGSGVFPWREYDRGNVIDAEDTEAWAARVMAPTYLGGGRGVDVKALKIEFTGQAMRHVLVFTDREVARELALDIIEELAKWEDA